MVGRMKTGCWMTLGTSLLFGPAIAHSQSSPTVTEYLGRCDASAAVAVGPDTFVVANDENATLRVYRRGNQKHLSEFKLKKSLSEADEDDDERDIEGAALLNGKIYWITSHGMKKDKDTGKLVPQPNRRRLFATELVVKDGVAEIKDPMSFYKNLVEDLEKAPTLKKYDLGTAATKGPEDKDGLNIEGLAATPQGHLLLAFRNPIPGRKALLVPLENPENVIKGQPAKLGVPIELDLDNRGIRSIDHIRERNIYLISAGSFGDSRDFAFYEWSGVASEAPKPRVDVNLQDLNPEALFTFPDGKSWMVLSDDGDHKVNGQKCKELDNAEERFRGMWIPF